MGKVKHNFYRTSRSLIHCVATCRECQWRNDDYLKASRAATRHVSETGHAVNVDQGIVYSVLPVKAEV